MQSASTSPENFARVFVDCDFITQYTLYCTGYSKGNKRLEQTLGAVCDIKEFITVSLNVYFCTQSHNFGDWLSLLLV